MAPCAPVHFLRSLLTRKGIFWRMHPLGKEKVAQGHCVRRFCAWASSVAASLFLHRLIYSQLWELLQCVCVISSSPQPHIGWPQEEVDDKQASRYYLLLGSIFLQIAFTWRIALLALKTSSDMLSFFSFVLSSDRNAIEKLLRRIRLRQYRRRPARKRRMVSFHSVFSGLGRSFHCHHHHGSGHSLCQIPKLQIQR